jgi:hypothetical protein
MRNRLIVPFMIIAFILAPIGGIFDPDIVDSGHRGTVQMITDASAGAINTQSRWLHTNHA